MKIILIALFASVVSPSVAQVIGGDGSVARRVLLSSEGTSIEKGGEWLLSHSALCTRSDTRQRQHGSRNGHFLIHYDITGDDAVPTLDANGNNVPDYIDSVDFYLEFAWNVSVDELGYTPPPPDTLTPGEGGVDGRIDVYICDHEPYFYGGSRPEPSSPTPAGGVASYMTLDNDYSESTYMTKGIDAVRATTAHEFPHVIQFASYRFDFEQPSWYEATSTWMERRTHPDVQDYRQYIDAFLKAPHKYPFSTHRLQNGVAGFGHALYVMHLVETYGEAIVREIWEEFRHRESFTAIDTVLRRHRSSLAGSYCTFATWSYHTGARAEGSSYFDEAGDFPTMGAIDTVFMAGPMVLGGAMHPLTFGLHRVVVPGSISARRDTLDLLVTNSRSDIEAGGSQLQSDPYVIEVRNDRLEGFVPVVLPEDTLYYRLTAEAEGIYCIAAYTIEQEGASSVDAGSLQMKPSDLSIHPNPAHDLAVVRFTLADRAGIRIMFTDALGGTVGSTITGMFEPGEHEQVVDLSMLADGVYFVEFRSGDEKVVQRFTVVR